MSTPNKPDVATATLLRIGGVLDQQPWSPETLNTLADIMRNAGFPIREPEEPSDE